MLNFLRKIKKTIQGPVFFTQKNLVTDYLTYDFEDSGAL